MKLILMGMSLRCVGSALRSVSVKANEYVKQNGWAMARKAVAECTYGYGIDLDDIKRLVEAHEIIKIFKSLDHAKTEAQACEHSKHSEILVKLDVGVGYIWLSRVKQAIADVESCQ